MPLTDIERDISKAVVLRFISENDSTSRRSLLKQFKGAVPEALTRLVSRSVLKNVGNSNEQFLPNALAFHYCGDKDALRFGKASVEVVLRALRALFEHELEDGQAGDYSPANVEAEVKKQHAEIRAETIRVGLYLAQEFGVLAGMRQNPTQTSFESVRIGEGILAINDVERAWDDRIRLNSARLEDDSLTRLPVEAGLLPAARKQATPEIRAKQFSSEGPINALTDDELGRGDFATAIAKVVGQWTGRDSLVLAIYGPWGSGKTSLKNMILDALGKQKAKTVPLEFNPWQWAGQDKVFEGFFGELSSNLGSVDPSKTAANAAKKIQMYAAMLSAAASITGGGRWLLVGFLSVLGFFGLAPIFHSPGIVVTLRIAGALALLFAVVLSSLGKTADKVAGYLTTKAEAIRRSVAEVKKDLRDLLGALDHNVLVVVDDIDRLTPHEIRMVFQLVKANADFPNLIYLLLFQRDTVEKALGRTGEAGEVDGAEFLQKVVQAGFDIPKITPNKLEESVESVISQILDGTAADKRFDARRWGKLFFSGISPYFQTLRDVKRFSNTLAFHFQLYKNASLFDANPVDVIALEVLRQFEVPIYQKLHANRALLTGAPREEFGPSFTGERRKAVEALLESAIRPKEAREILTDVFPTIVRPLAESAGIPLVDMPPDVAFRNEWLRDLRACHPDVFERYFRFSLSTEDLSEGEFASLLASMPDRTDFANKLRQSNARGLLGAALVKLRANSISVPSEQIVSFVTGLFDVELELFSQQTSSRVATVPAANQAIFIIASVLRQRQSDTRGVILGEAIKQTTGLFLPMISFESSDEERGQAVDPIVSDQEAKSLKELCIKKIRDASLKPELPSHPRLRLILRLWSKWASTEEVSAWFAGVSDSDSCLSALLRAFVEAMNELEGQRVVRVLYRFALEEFDTYTKPDVVVGRIRRLALVEGENQFVFRLFLRAFDRWKASGHLPYPQLHDEWTTLDKM
jgi:predicted KAP-like P-loop ATPase